MRYDASLIAGALVYGNDDLGITGAVIRATTAPGTNTDGAGLLYNDWDSSADDNKRFRALIISGAPANSFFLEDGSFIFPEDTAAGTYTITYRLFVDGADLGTSTATVVVGTITFALSVNSIDNVIDIGVPTATFAIGSVFAISMPSISNSSVLGTPDLYFNFPAVFSIAFQSLDSQVSIGVPVASFQIEQPVTPPTVPPTSGTARVALTASGQLVVLIP